MSRPREGLHNILVNVMRSINPEYASHVYFQAPTRLQYPAIVYSLSTGDTTFADNGPYIYMKKYSVTVIDADPDSPIPDVIASLPRCIFDRTYVADNLHHTVFSIYY